jgi:NTP pyrophosphatase (non-canonical NTP hydrolase)
MIDTRFREKKARVRSEMENQIQNLSDILVQFREERSWKQFHTPKNLAISISVEAAELLEHFQWKKEDDDVATESRAEIAKELADIFIYLLLLSNDLGIDLLETAFRKVEENRRKYPVGLAKGSARKYTQLRGRKKHART